jgi:hypothetical protein
MEGGGLSSGGETYLSTQTIAAERTQTMSAHVEPPRGWCEARARHATPTTAHATSRPSCQREGSIAGEASASHRESRVRATAWRPVRGVRVRQARRTRWAACRRVPDAIRRARRSRRIRARPTLRGTRCSRTGRGCSSRGGNAGDAQDGTREMRRMERGRCTGWKTERQQSSGAEAPFSSSIANGAPDESEDDGGGRPPESKAEGDDLMQRTAGMATWRARPQAYISITAGDPASQEEIQHPDRLSRFEPLRGDTMRCRAWCRRATQRASPPRQP